MCRGNQISSPASLVPGKHKQSRKVGEIARIDGLCAATHLNGRIGLVLGMDDERAQLKLVATAREHIPTAGKVVSMQLQHLTPYYLAVSQLWICAVCKADVCHPQFHSTVGWGMSGNPKPLKRQCPACSGHSATSPVEGAEGTSKGPPQPRPNEGGQGPSTRTALPPPSPSPSERAPKTDCPPQTRPKDMPTHVAKAFLCLRIDASKGRGISKTELVGAYRQGCLRTHPDKGGSNELFVETKAAYQTILEYIEMGIPSPVTAQNKGVRTAPTHTRESRQQVPPKQCNSGTPAVVASNRRKFSWNPLGLLTRSKTRSENLGVPSHSRDPDRVAAPAAAKAPDRVVAPAESSRKASAQQPAANMTEKKVLRIMRFTLQKLYPDEKVGLILKLSSGRLVVTEILPNSAVERTNNEHFGGVSLLVGDTICSVNGHIDVSKINECFLSDEQKVVFELEVEFDVLPGQ